MHSVNGDNDPENTTEEVNLIKESIKDLSKRLNNLKGEALHALSENSDELKTTLDAIKNKLMSEGSQISLRPVYSYIEKNSLKGALIFFASGAIFSMLLRK